MSDSDLTPKLFPEHPAAPKAFEELLKNAYDDG